MSKSKEYSRLNAQQFKGKLHYNININQLGLMVSGLHGQIALKEMIILDYVQALDNYYSKRGDMSKFTYVHLIKALPMLKELRCYSKSSVSRVIYKLEKLGLLEVSRKKGCSINACVTEKAIDIMNFSVENGVSAIEKQGVSVRKKHSVSAKEKRGVPAKEKHNSINNRVNDNLTIVEQSDSETITDEKIDKYRDEALEYYQSLEPEQRILFDSLAYNLLDSTCPRPRPGSVEMNRLRVQRYIYDMEGRK